MVNFVSSWFVVGAIFVGGGGGDRFGAKRQNARKLSFFVDCRRFLRKAPTRPKINVFVHCGLLSLWREAQKRPKNCVFVAVWCEAPNWPKT